jgi:hypothetical protein
MGHFARLKALGTILSLDTANHLLDTSMTGRPDFPPILCMKCKVVWHAPRTRHHHHHHLPQQWQCASAAMSYHDKQASVLFSFA